MEIEKHAKAAAVRRVSDQSNSPEPKSRAQFARANNKNCHRRDGPK